MTQATVGHDVYSHNPMAIIVFMRVSVAEAKNSLTQLIYAVEQGQQITICRRGVPVIDLVKSKEAPVEQRKFGTAKGRGEILDPNWAKPVETPEELEAWLAGKF